MRCFEQINLKNKNMEDNIQQGRKYRYTRVARLSLSTEHLIRRRLLLKSFSIQHVQSILLNYPLQFSTT